MTPISGSASTTRRAILVEVTGCFRCDNCQVPSIAKATGLPGDQDLLAWLARKKKVQWIPQPPRVIPLKVFPDVPTEIASAASEAYRCRQVCNANRAAIIMARCVIEATAKDRGITAGPLISKIDELHEQRLIRPDVRDGAHEIRQFGNDVAHGDFVRDARSEEADLVLALMDAVLGDVYQSPAQVARAKAAREQRREANAMFATTATGGRELPPDLPPYIRAALFQMQSLNPADPPGREIDHQET